MDFSQQYGSQDSSESLAYDLRQKYALIVGMHLEEVAIARKERNFSKYFNALDDLYTITSHKFKPPKKRPLKLKDKDILNSNLKWSIKVKFITYTELKDKFIKLTNDYRGAYLGHSNNPEHLHIILEALKELERFIYYKMDEAGMFGSKRDVESLI